MHLERLESSQTTEFRVILGIVQTSNFWRKIRRGRRFFRYVLQKRVGGCEKFRGHAGKEEAEDGFGSLADDKGKYSLLKHSSRSHNINILFLAFSQFRALFIKVFFATKARIRWVGLSKDLGKKAGTFSFFSSSSPPPAASPARTADPTIPPIDVGAPFPCTQRTRAAPVARDAIRIQHMRAGGAG